MGEVLTLTVGVDDEGTRLDRWFRRRFPQVTQGALNRLLRTGQVRVDGRRVEAGSRLGAGQVVRVPPLPDAPPPPAPRPAVDPELARTLLAAVVHRDAHVIALDKPAGLATQGGSGTRRHVDGGLDALAFDGERPRLVHRLDKDTSGLLLLARTLPAARALQAAFRSRDIRKYYWAAVVGVPQPYSGTISSGLAKGGPAGRQVMTEDDEDGRPAVTDYAIVEKAGKSAAWVALWPRTGRTHQLRAHMAGLGTPILGDGKYAGAGAQIPGADLPRRLHLHARRLILPHPSGTGMLDLKAPLPPHMRETWRWFGFDLQDDGDPFAGR